MHKRMLYRFGAILPFEMCQIILVRIIWGRGEGVIAEDERGKKKDLKQWRHQLRGKRTWRKGKENVLLLEKFLVLRENQNSMYLFPLQIARIPRSLINPEL